MFAKSSKRLALILVILWENTMISLSQLVFRLYSCYRVADLAKALEGTVTRPSST